MEENDFYEDQDNSETGWSDLGNDVVGSNQDASDYSHEDDSTYYDQDE